MSARSYEIRVCQNPACGLRYPLTEEHPFGERCPLCLGETRVVLRAGLPTAPEASRVPRDRRRGSILLDNIRSAWNTGSILRSADGLGFRHAYLCGITPTPENAEVRKTALGAQDFVSWSAHRDGAKLAQQLAGEGSLLIALEAGQDAIPLSDLELGGFPAEKIVLAVGSERTGIDPDVLKAAARVVGIPMRGQKRSFNVAAAFAIAGYELQKKMGEQAGGSG